MKTDTTSKAPMTSSGVTEKITSKGATTLLRLGMPTPSNQRQTTARRLEASSQSCTRATASSQNQ